MLLARCRECQPRMPFCENISFTVANAALANGVLLMAGVCMSRKTTPREVQLGGSLLLMSAKKGDPHGIIMACKRLKELGVRFKVFITDGDATAADALKIALADEGVDFEVMHVRDANHWCVLTLSLSLPASVLHALTRARARAHARARARAHARAHAHTHAQARK
jgi:hypothetical protein